MTEDILHHIWQFRLFNNQELKLQSGESLQIINPGSYNTNAGPDFFNSRLKIGDVEWAGNVEIHINSSDWKKHNHHNDNAYRNIILHVVFNDDEEIIASNGKPFPTLILNDKIEASILNKYSDLKACKDWIPCAQQIKGVNEFTLNSWLDRLILERLELKCDSVLKSLELNKNNWEETFYQHLARNFGFKINAEPFELLAKSLPNSILGKHKSLPQIEALLFGQAGMLDIFSDDSYVKSLQNEYAFLKHKFSLKPIDEHLWKYLRLRPANFPTVRIAQFSALIYKSSNLFSRIIEIENIKEIEKLLDVQASEYWNIHYNFDKSSNAKIKVLGSDSINNIMINTIVPFLFVYGKHLNEEKYINRALRFLELIHAENNSIIKNWETFGIKVKSAYQSQALLQLKNNYCSKIQCLKCAIGAKLLAQKPNIL